MFAAYIIFNDGQTSHLVVSDPISLIRIRQGRDLLDYWKPSECLWMVPGTVDPMDD